MGGPVARLSTPAVSRHSHRVQAGGMGHLAIATPVRVALRAAVRLVVMGAALAGYYAAMPLLFPDDDGANIGAGLIAFGVVALVSLGWAYVDGRRRGAAATTATWAVVAVAFGTLWLLGLALVETDDGMTLAERLRFDAFLAVWTAGLVFLPAGVGAAIGGTAHRPDTAHQPDQT